MNERRTDNWGMVFLDSLEATWDTGSTGKETFTSLTMKGNQMGVM